jgi:hypothetical protein
VRLTCADGDEAAGVARQDRVAGGGGRAAPPPPDEWSNPQASWLVGGRRMYCVSEETMDTPLRKYRNGMREGENLLNTDKFLGPSTT